MELIINYPIDDDGKKIFESKFAQFQSLLVKKCIDDLNIDSTSKKKLIDGIANAVSNKIETEIINKMVWHEWYLIKSYFFIKKYSSMNTHMI